MDEMVLAGIVMFQYEKKNLKRPPTIDTGAKYVDSHLFTPAPSPPAAPFGAPFSQLRPMAEKNVIKEGVT
ncbi:hypothetical protein CH63R_12150 [Colletotrichum higginsianum IMI 349063]|uniref:Uncharacterized protein n=2 Tax=Colletotrichum higginsianum (strain IMI 349063) TaxID=759273 RepID=A0A1B7Y0B0_COLHI|nr:hypothetical protein CH63R_12150 [Colletotrichum higginsianum IMI 349063]OBR05447.1 hypothetical protein CH63R_12150 [Colletotrichum higginsianum IMI 349063]